jgi:hypothetical protein
MICLKRRKGCVFDSIEGAADIGTQSDNIQQVVDHY